MSNVQLQLFTTGFYVEKITHIEAMSLISRYHYLKGLSHAAQNFGAFHNGALVGVVSFAVPVSESTRCMVFGEEYKDHVKELVRLCLVPDCSIPASRIVSESIKSLKAYRDKHNMPAVHGLISFADTDQGHHGGVYQAMSWLYTGESQYKMRKYCDPTGRFRHHRQNGQHISPQQAKDLGWSVKIEKSVKHRYIKILGSKTQQRYFKSRLKLAVMPYPKNSKL